MNEGSNKGRKHPWTTAELFLKICEILKEKGIMPEILDYALPTSAQVKITSEEFRLRNSLDYGGNEGIYLDVYLEFRGKDGNLESRGLGIFKTLLRDRDAMHTMAGLLADFIVEVNTFVNENLDDFTWEGADVFPCNEDGQRGKWSITCRTMEKALQRKDELLKEHPIVGVRNNETRKTVIYRRDECKIIEIYHR